VKNAHAITYMTDPVPRPKAILPKTGHLPFSFKRHKTRKALSWSRIENTGAWFFKLWLSQEIKNIQKLKIET
jgi:hypothetical protein